eukprot:Selendium_serpulae@DN295_c0_g1_i2.p1
MASLVTSAPTPSVDGAGPDDKHANSGTLSTAPSQIPAALLNSKSRFERDQLVAALFNGAHLALGEWQQLLSNTRTLGQPINDAGSNVTSEKAVSLLSLCVGVYRAIDQVRSSSSSSSAPLGKCDSSPSSTIGDAH